MIEIKKLLTKIIFKAPFSLFVIVSNAIENKIEEIIKSSMGFQASNYKI
jgi:hypothetical protein